MLITPRTFGQLQVLQEDTSPGSFGPARAVGWRVSPDTVSHTQKMLLVHQVGSVRVGEVVRYVSSSTTNSYALIHSIKLHPDLYALT